MIECHSNLCLSVANVCTWSSQVVTRYTETQQAAWDMEQAAYAVVHFSLDNQAAAALELPKLVFKPQATLFTLLTPCKQATASCNLA